MANRKNYVANVPRAWTVLAADGSTTAGSYPTHRHAHRTASDYSRKKPRGRWLPPTAYGLEEVVDDGPHGSVSRIHKSFGTRLTTGAVHSSSARSCLTDHFAKIGMSDSFPAGLSNQALLKARLKIKSSDINLAQAFAERAQTSRYVAQQIDRMAELIWKFRKRNFISWRRYFQGKNLSSRLLKDLQSEWLALQYALRPLMSDIHGAVTTLDRKNPRDQYMVTVKAVAKQKYRGTTYHSESGSNVVTEHHSAQIELNAVAFVRIDLIPDNAALILASRFGFTNPVSLSWELTRLSFVVDWAWPLGDYFDQFDATLGYEVKGFSSSKFLRCSAKLRGTNWSDAAGYNYVCDWDASYYKVYLDRTVSTSVPFATLPSVKNPMSGSHVMTALALLRQACSF